jgi:hypothetical protein
VEPVTHEELQQQVIDLAHLLGWRHLHVRRSIGKGRRWQTTTNVVGWPDLLLWSPRQPGRHVAVELKIPPDKLRPEQEACLAELEASGFEVHVVFPDTFDALTHVLRRRRSAHAPE